MGRYFYYRLHPFSLLEMNQTPNKQDLKYLLKFRGFPEPLFGQSEKNSHSQLFQFHLSNKDFGNDKKGERSLPFVAFCREILKI